MLHASCFMKMEEPTQKNTPQKGPGIRTMKTDVAEYLKETKPSLLSILTREMKLDETMPEPGYKLKTHPRWLSFLAVLIIVLLFAGGGYGIFIYFKGGEGGNGGGIIIPPKPIFATEKTRTILARDDADLLRNLQTLGDENERDGLITKLDMRMLETKEATPLTPEVFLKIIGAKPPSEFYANHTSALNTFLYSDRGFSRFGMLLGTRNGSRSLQQMLSWEPTIQRDLEPLFLGRLPESTVGVFTDKRYRNINYRFLALSRSEDLGIGYFLFDVKKYFIITTSEKAIEVIINRLFEAN